MNLLKVLTACGVKNPANWVEPLTDTFTEFGLTTEQHQQFFLAQVLHESGGFHYLREIWGPTAAQIRYEGRKDLGNVVAGDGVKFKGRGLIQITGRLNYTACGKSLGLDLLTHPELLEQPLNAARSAGWFWSKNGLNALADKGDFVGVTKRINGGTNGLANRQTYLAKIKGVV